MLAEEFGEVVEVPIEGGIEGRFAEEVFGVGVVGAVFKQPSDELDVVGKRGGVNGLIAFGGGFLEQWDDDFGHGGLAAMTDVEHQRQTVRATGGGGGGGQFNKGGDGGRVAEHRGGETVGARSVFEEIADDILSAHVGRTFEAGFPIAVAPIPARDGEARVGGEHGLHFVQVAMGGLHEVEDRT